MPSSRHAILLPFLKILRDATTLCYDARRIVTPTLKALAWITLDHQ
jgi:hypothetical protein